MFKYKINFTLLLIALFAISACKEHEELIQPVEDGAFPVVSNITSSFFDIANLEGTNVAFDLATEGAAQINSIDIWKSYNGGPAIAHSNVGNPATVSLNLGDVLNGLTDADGNSVSTESLALGDNIQLSFRLNTSDGRALISNQFFDAPVSCASIEAGAIPVFSNVVSDFFAFNDLDGANVTFDITTEGAADIVSIDILKSYNDGPVVAHNTVTNPSTVSIDLSDALNGLIDADGNSVSTDSLSLGDKIQFSFMLNASDGCTLTSDQFFDAPVSCPSSLDGTYLLTSNVLFSDFGPKMYEYEITLTNAGGGKYPLEDITGGAWGINYAAEYGASARAGTLNDICDVLSIPEVDDQFGYTIVVTDLAIDENGVISYKWNDTFYDDNGEITLTPQ